MKKVLIAIVALGVAAGIYFLAVQESTDKEGISIPSLSTSEVEAILEKKKPIYEAGGFNFSKVGDHYTLIANDEQKVRGFLFKELAKTLPTTYAPMLSQLESSLTSEKAEVFKGTVVDMDIVEDSDGAKVEVSLKMLPATLSTALQRDQKIDSIVTNFLAKGGFSYKLSLNRAGEIQGIELRDIDEKITLDNETMTLKVLDAWMRMDGDINSKMVSAMGNKEFVFGVDEGKEKAFTFTMKDFTGTGKQSSVYDQKSNMSIGNISLNMKEFGDIVSIVFDAISANTVAKSSKGFFDAGYSFDAKHFLMRSTNMAGVEQFGVNIDGFTLGAKTEHVNIEAMEALQNINNQSLSTLLSGTPAAENPEAAMQALLKILQSGLSVHLDALNGTLIDIKMANGMPPIALHDFKFDLHVVLKENTLNMNMPMQYIPFVKITGTLELNQKDLDTISSTLPPMAGVFLAMKKIVGSQAVYELEFDQGHLKVNGTQVQ